MVGSEVRIPPCTAGSVLAAGDTRVSDPAYWRVIALSGMFGKTLPVMVGLAIEWAWVGGGSLRSVIVVNGEDVVVVEW